MSALKRRLLIAEAAIAIPDAEKTPWDVFKASGVLTAQSRGVIAQNLVCSVLKGQNVPSSADRGDFLFDGRHYEVKSSFTAGKANVRQVRPWQDVDYIVVHVNVEDIEDCQCYRLNHDQMMAEVELMGCVSHGTKSAVEGNVNREYSLTVPTRSKRESENATRWATYRDQVLESLLF